MLKDFGVLEGNLMTASTPNVFQLHIAYNVLTKVNDRIARGAMQDLRWLHDLKASYRPTSSSSERCRFLQGRQSQDLVPIAICSCFE
jgi:hypothetical protein